MDPPSACELCVPSPPPFCRGISLRVPLQKGPVFHLNAINHRLGNKYRCCVCSSTVSQVPEESLPLSAFSDIET